MEALHHEPSLQKMVRLMQKYFDEGDIKGAKWCADEIEKIVDYVMRFLSGEDILDVCEDCDEDEKYSNSAHCICDGSGCLAISLPLY